MRLMTTQTVHQISPYQYQYRDHRSVENHDIHRVTQDTWSISPELYSDTDRTMLGGDMSIYYRARPKGEQGYLDMPYDRWVGFLQAVSDHFLGAPLETVLSDPEPFAELPLYPLVFINCPHVLLGVPGAQRLLGDFLNVSGDGMAKDFIARVQKEHPEEDYKSLYKQLLVLLPPAFLDGGSFLLQR